VLRVIRGLLPLTFGLDRATGFCQKPAIGSGRSNTMKEKIATFFRGFGSVLSAYLLLIIGTGILASVFNFSHPLAGSPIIVLTIFIGAPFSLLFTVPAFVLSFNWNASRTTKVVVASLNGLGIVCSLASMLWAFFL